MINKSSETLTAPETLACVSRKRNGWGPIYFTSFPGLQFGHDGETYIQPEAMVEVLIALENAGVKKLVLLPKRSEFPPGADLLLMSTARTYEIEVLRLPVVDFSVPDQVGEALWRDFVPELTMIVTGGSGIAFSCLTGIGRSASFAARTLCELGTPRQEAIAKVREVLPAAIETTEQEHWVGQTSLFRRNQNDHKRDKAS